MMDSVEAWKPTQPAEYQVFDTDDQPSCIFPASITLAWLQILSALCDWCRCVCVCVCVNCMISPKANCTLHAFIGNSPKLFFLSLW